MPSNFELNDTSFDNIFVTPQQVEDDFATDTTVYSFAWGDNTNGALGIGNNVNKSLPVQSGSHWGNNYCGKDYTIELNQDWWGTGKNTNGELGDGQRTTLTSFDRVYDNNLSHFGTLSLGDAQSFGIRSNKTLWGWGRNTGGTLGDGTSISRSSPVQIGTDSNWEEVSVGGNSFVIAVDSNRELWSWGTNSLGQLGTDNYVNTSLPAKISGVGWRYPSAGLNHVACIKQDYTLWMWGDNSQGQLGDNSTINKLHPVQIGLGTWSQVSCSKFGNFTAAINNSGAIFAWGDNSNGQLGIGSIISKSSPVQITAYTGWSEIGCGKNYTLAVKTDGTLWAWGNNTYGQLGDGTVLQKNSPIQIGINVDWTGITVGSTHNFASGVIKNPYA